ncbi:DinB family protein [Ilumatobacter sp.]|uniref:DinB family protein n=1 Tax=Ilumatobacter sp. TaxID=1967498 RepID=UPI003AF42920
MLLSYLDFYRAVLHRKCAGLGPEQLRTTVASSSLTLGRLLRHMAMVEDFWFGEVLHDREPAAEWADADWERHPDWEMDTADDFSPAELGRQFDDAVARSRAAIADVALDELAARPGRHGPTNLRWILVHMIEEYARHCGHADLIREAVDGRTGD